MEENIQRNKRSENTEKSKRDIEDTIIRSNMCNWCTRREKKENWDSLIT